MAKNTVKARVLSAFVLDGVAYAPNQVVNLPKSAAKDLQEQGAIDPGAEAIAYAMDHEGAVCIEHKAADEPEAQPDPAADAAAA